MKHTTPTLLTAIFLAFSALIFTFSQCSKPTKPTAGKLETPDVVEVKPQPTPEKGLQLDKNVPQAKVASKRTATVRKGRVSNPTKCSPAYSTVTPSWSGLPAVIQIQVSGPITPAKVRIRLAWARKPLKYYPGERVAGMDIPVGLMLTEHVPNPNPLHEIPTCDHRRWAPCLLPMNGKVYVLGKCFNERLEVDARCEKQMVRDLK